MLPTPDQLFLFAENPALLFVLIIAVSWLWEDAAVFAAALLALDGRMTLSSAFVASFVGITSGDLALYLLGRLGYRWRGLRARILLGKRARMARRRFRHRTLSNIFIIRFIPGLRTLGFTFCGLWRIPARRFVFAMVAAGIVWILAIFSLIHLFGLSEALRNSPWKWSLMAGALLMLLLNNLLIPRLTAPVREVSE